MTRTAEDLTGQRFGRWLVERKSVNSGQWMCRCDCGLLLAVRTQHLISGATRQCGHCRRAGRVNRHKG